MEAMNVTETHSHSKRIKQAAFGSQQSQSKEWKPGLHNRRCCRYPACIVRKCISSNHPSTKVTSQQLTGPHIIQPGMRRLCNAVRTRSVPPPVLTAEAADERQEEVATGSRVCHGGSVGINAVLTRRAGERGREKADTSPPCTGEGCRSDNSYFGSSSSETPTAAPSLETLHGMREEDERRGSEREVQAN